MEWIGEIHLFSPTSTFGPEQGAVSNTDLGAGPTLSSNVQIPTMSVKGRGRKTLPGMAMPIIMKGASRDMEEQLEVANMTGQLVGTNSELYETRENDMTPERDNIFMWKDDSDIDSLSTCIESTCLMHQYY